MGDLKQQQPGAHLHLRNPQSAKAITHTQDTALST